MVEIWAVCAVVGTWVICEVVGAWVVCAVVCAWVVCACAVVGADVIVVLLVDVFLIVVAAVDCFLVVLGAVVVLFAKVVVRLVVRRVVFTVDGGSTDEKNFGRL